MAQNDESLFAYSNSNSAITVFSELGRFANRRVLYCTMDFEVVIWIRIKMAFLSFRFVSVFSDLFIISCRIIIIKKILVNFYT
jgi:hypothetical protein